MDFERKVWLLGSGRSGTTWVSTLINYNKTFRELFEPFHPKLVSDFNFLKFHQYQSLSRKEDKLSSLSQRIFNGEFHHPRVERGNRQFENLLVKDVFANLFAFSICQEQAEIRPILLIRHPFSVALSKSKLNDWHWMRDPADFLSQEELVNDYLSPFVPLIEDVSVNGTTIEKYILIWSIINYVPILQFDSSRIEITFYENWVRNPITELRRIYQFLDLAMPNEGDSRLISNIEKVSNLSNRRGTDFNTWSKDVSDEEIKNGNYILKQFGFEKLYGLDSTPNEGVIDEIRLDRIG